MAAFWPVRNRRLFYYIIWSRGVAVSPYFRNIKPSWGTLKTNAYLATKLSWTYSHCQPNHVARWSGISSRLQGAQRNSGFHGFSFLRAAEQAVATVQVQSYPQKGVRLCLTGLTPRRVCICFKNCFIRCVKWPPKLVPTSWEEEKKEIKNGSRNAIDTRRNFIKVLCRSPMLGNPVSWIQVPIVPV